MKKKIFVILIFILLTLLAVSCDNNEREPEFYFEDRVCEYNSLPQRIAAASNIDGTFDYVYKGIGFDYESAYPPSEVGTYSVRVDFESEKGHQIQKTATLIIGNEFIFNEEKDAVLGYNGTSNEVFIPNYCYGEQVTTLSSWAFLNNTLLETVILSRNITTIQEDAFYGADNLTKLIAYGEAELSIIGDVPNSLKELEIHKKTCEINGNAFKGVTQIPMLSIPYDLGDLDYQEMFDNSTFSALRLSNIDILQNELTSSIISIYLNVCYSYYYDTSHFPDQPYVKELILINDTTNIDDIFLTSVFSEYSGLERIYTPAYVQNHLNFVNGIHFIIDEGTLILPHYMLSGVNMKKISLPDSLISIGNKSMDGNGIEEITIPGNVTNIGDYAFYNCLNLSIVIMESITPPTLGEQAFYDTHVELKIYVPAESLDVYKNASGWSDHKDRIFAIAE